MNWKADIYSLFLDTYDFTKDNNSVIATKESIFQADVVRKRERLHK